MGAEPLAQEEQQAGVLALIRAFLLKLVWVVVQECQKCCHRSLEMRAPLINSSGTVPGMLNFVASKRRQC